jgi:PhnB protein
MQVVDQAYHSNWRCIPAGIGFQDSATIKNVQLNPYLTFDGQCEEAFRFYEKCLGAKISFSMTHGDSPEPTPPNWRNKIIHSTLAVGDQVLQGVDALPGQYQKPQGFSLSLNVNDPAEAERIFDALAESGAVLFPLKKTFWALLFGMLTDKFGIPWMINCGYPA